MRVAVMLGGSKPMVGGGFTFEDDLLNGLLDVAAESSHEFHVLNSGPDNDRLRAASSNVRSLEVPGYLWRRERRVFSVTAEPALLPFRMMGLRSALDRKLGRHGIDMVWFVTPILAATDLPYVYTVWDLQHRLQPWFPEVSTRGRWAYRERSYRTAIQRAALVIAPNSAGEEELERFYGLPSERVLKLPHPTPRFALQAHGTARELPSSMPVKEGYLFYPAQFWPHKNHIAIVRALNVLAQRGEQVPHAIFVGSDAGNREFVLEQARALGVSNYIHHLGFVSRDDIVALYQHALALVYPSYFGPENLPPLEAFALGCPVIAASSSGMGEQLGDAALLVAPSDHEGLAAAIRRLASDANLRATLAQRGISRARQWTATDYVRAVAAALDRFSPVRATWP